MKSTSFALAIATMLSTNPLHAADLSDPAHPVGYFTFASDANIVLSQNLTKIAKDLNGNIMLGGDASYPTVNSEFIQVMRKADSLGGQKHVYLEGPGGPTGSGGIAADECQRMISRARAVGITIDRNDCSSKAKWIQKWNDYGWWDSMIVEIKYFYNKYRVSSVEVDNLYRAGVEDSASVVRFLRRFQEAMAANQLPVSIMLKNLTVDDLTLIKKDIAGGDPARIRRSSLTDFMISEEDFRSDWPAIKRASKLIGITTLESRDTYNYQARGYYQP